MAHLLQRHAAHYRAHKRSGRTHILVDVGLIAVSVLVAVILSQTHALTRILTSTQELELIGTFIAGMFFTSVFTTAPAIATLGEISLVQPLFLTAFLGALGSVLGDLLIFRFVKDRVASDVLELLKPQSTFRRLKAVFKLKFFRRFTFLLAALVIASPLPDELGIAMLGFSKMSTRYFAMFSLVFNFFGIYLIGLAARALV